MCKGGRGGCAAQVGRVCAALGHATNNVAEYMGLILGLRAAHALGVQDLWIFGDSKLVVEQVLPPQPKKLPCFPCAPKTWHPSSFRPFGTAAAWVFALGCSAATREGCCPRHAFDRGTPLAPHTAALAPETVARRCRWRGGGKSRARA